MPRIMLVDDDENHLKAMRRVLMLGGWSDIEKFNSPSKALERAREAQFDVVIADYRMPEMDGASFLESFRQIQPEAFRIILSGMADVELFRAAINRAQIHHYLQKPCDGFTLTQIVEQGLARAELNQELHRVRAERDHALWLLERRTALLRGVAEKSPELLPADWERG